MIMKLFPFRRIPGSLLLPVLFLSCSVVPPSYTPASRSYVDSQSLRTYGILDTKIKDLKKLESQLDSLIDRTEQNNRFIAQLRVQNSSLSEEFSRQIVSKDTEIQKLNLQISSLQNVVGYYEGIMDSLLTLNSRQSNIYNQLLSVEDSDGSKPESIQKRQLLVVQKNLDSLQLSYSNLAKTTKNLYEDLSIVESSIMDIIQYSFEKSSQQIRDKQVFLSDRYNEINTQFTGFQTEIARHDSLLSVVSNSLERNNQALTRTVSRLDSLQAAQNSMMEQMKLLQRSGQYENKADSTRKDLK